MPRNPCVLTVKAIAKDVTHVPRNLCSLLWISGFGDISNLESAGAISKPDLKETIKREIANIPPAMIRLALLSAVSRMQCKKASDGTLVESLHTYVIRIKVFFSPICVVLSDWCLASVICGTLPCVSDHYVFFFFSCPYSIAVIHVPFQRSLKLLYVLIILRPLRKTNGCYYS
ncbi:hypothetical protein TNIN_357361 [Trichonephila inaurata madagascariensis]|uniref:Uncharacterized protein n=1 Tax=Trichonephila inaurata madagascariensis TaxID=2747483 RepID=A0A8X7CP14_9ARAC|nr:hypothetical protein TNIN_357361 [Trichonephila inaurata madagascariensis]